MSEENKNEILKEKVDKEEMDAINGGNRPPVTDERYSERHRALKEGGCSRNYYRQNCTATVEDGSWCWTNDRCHHFSEQYDVI